MKVLVGISWCAAHAKGANPWEAGYLPGEEHAAWLRECCEWWSELDGPRKIAGHYLGHYLAVCATAYPGILNVDQSPGNHERDELWKVHGLVDHFLGIPDNPGHQVGAALCIRIALEAAAKLGYDALIFTAEDLLPERGFVERMLGALGEGVDFAGVPWGPEPQDEWSAQFFVCKPEALVGPWDACQVTAHGCIETYLTHLLREKRTARFKGAYRHTHDHTQWNEWRKELST